jgi:hypothetical protein
MVSSDMLVSYKLHIEFDWRSASGSQTTSFFFSFVLINNVFTQYFFPITYDA